MGFEGALRRWGVSTAARLLPHVVREAFPNEVQGQERPVADGAMRDDLPVGAGCDLPVFFQDADIREILRRFTHPNGTTKLRAKVWHANLHTHMMTPDPGAVEMLVLFFVGCQSHLSCARMAEW